MFTGPVDRLRQLLPEVDAARFDLPLFDEAGVFVVRNALPASIVGKAVDDWSEFRDTTLVDRQVNRFNPVAVQEAVPPELDALYDNEHVMAIARQIFGDHIALYSFRFIVKDRHARDGVFLHNDVGYHSGRGVNASFFIPLSECNSDNGALSFYPGTHMLGYLGDVGELNPGVLQPGWPKLTPSLRPGDVVVMSSALWHESGAHRSGPDRVVADIILKSARDPFYRKIVRGQAQTAYGADDSGKPFVRSRVSRLIEYQARIDKLPDAGGS